MALFSSSDPRLVHQVFCYLEEARCTPLMVLEKEGEFQINFSQMRNFKKVLGVLALVIVSLLKARFPIVSIEIRWQFQEQILECLKIFEKHLKSVLRQTKKTRWRVKTISEEFCLHVVNLDSRGTKTIYFRFQN